MALTEDDFRDSSLGWSGLGKACGDSSFLSCGASKPESLKGGCTNESERHPLYAWLTQQSTQPEGPGDVQWNFGKFLIGRDGSVLARFEPPTAPDAPELTAAIEAAL